MREAEVGKKGERGRKRMGRKEETVWGEGVRRKRKERGSG